MRGIIETFRPLSAFFRMVNSFKIVNDNSETYKFKMLIRELKIFVNNYTSSEKEIRKKTETFSARSNKNTSDNIKTAKCSCCMYTQYLKFGSRHQKANCKYLKLSISSRKRKKTKSMNRVGIDNSMTPGMIKVKVQSTDYNAQ